MSPVPAAPRFSPSPPFCCSSGSVQPYAYLGLLNITGTARRPRPYPGTHAWRGHGVAKSPRNRKKRGWGKGRAAAWGQERQGAASRELLGGKADQIHQRRWGRQGVQPQVLSGRGRGAGGLCSSLGCRTGVGQGPPGPGAVCGVGGTARPCWGVLRVLQGCFLRWVLAAHVAAPEEVARGSLSFVTSARPQRGAGGYLQSFSPFASPAPGSRLPAAPLGPAVPFSFTPRSAPSALVVLEAAP